VVSELQGAGSLGPKRLDADPQLQLELAVCAVYRVRHSEFLDWLASDRDKAIWQFLRERQTCPHCGTRDEEWLDDTGKRKQAYIAHLIECEGCVVKERGEKEFEVELREFRGTRVGLIRNEEVA
jgi:hypothetical protein